MSRSLGALKLGEAILKPCDMGRVPHTERNHQPFLHLRDLGQALIVGNHRDAWATLDRRLIDCNRTRRQRGLDAPKPLFRLFFVF
jgi:hypothetical protein